MFVYTVTIVTASEVWSGTDSSIYLVLMGDSGIRMDLGVINQDELVGSLQTAARDTFIFTATWDLGPVQCVEFNSFGTNAWMLESVSVTRNSEPGISYDFNNADNIWLSSDLSEGVDYLKLCDSDYLIVEENPQIVH